MNTLFSRWTGFLFLWSGLLWSGLASTSVSACIPESGHQQTKSEPAIQVVASIKPLALIAQDLLGELGRAEPLITGAASPHDYALAVSDVRRLRQADLVIWMGPGLERFLEKPLTALPGEKKLKLADRGEARTADVHLWLDPVSAQAMARAIAGRLQALYPEQQATIERRLATQLQEYQQLDRELEQRLAPVKARGFVVEHRGYDQLVEAYGLNQVGWISRTPDQPPGVRHLYELEQTLASGQGAKCLFVELSHPSAAAENLAAQLGLEVRPLDILGQSAASYMELMRNLANEVADCLGGA